MSRYLRTPPSRAATSTQFVLLPLRLLLRQAGREVRVDMGIGLLRGRVGDQLHRLLG
jgi:hypothetical protein